MSRELLVGAMLGGAATLGVVWILSKFRRQLDRTEGRSGMSKEKLDVLLVAFVLLLVAVLLFWWAYVTEDHFRQEVIFALAHAAVVVGGFSLLLELPHVTNFVVREMGKILYGKEYLERNRILIPEIRKTADLVYYGEPEVAYAGSLYNFIDRNVHRYYLSHYRKQYQEFVSIKRIDGELLSLEVRTRYTFVRSPSRHVTAKKLEIPFFSSFNPKEKMKELADHLLKLELRVGEMTFRLNETKTALSGGSAKQPVTIPFEQHRDAERIDYGFSYEIADGALSDLGEVEIEIVELTRIPVEPSAYAIRMSLPTQNFTLICDAPPDMRLIPTSFDMNLTEESTEALGHVVITINDWLLPGHGACLTWDIDGNKKG